MLQEVSNIALFDEDKALYTRVPLEQVACQMAQDTMLDRGIDEQCPWLSVVIYRLPMSLWTFRRGMCLEP